MKLRTVWFFLSLMAAASCGVDNTPRLVLGSTHTLEDSGILDVLTAAYREEHPESERLSVVVAGSGEILRMAERGDIDVVLSHSPAAETAFVAAGGAESREPVMHSDFVVLGPRADPAGVATAASAPDALRRIASAEQAFVSRGDDSGTHHKERELLAGTGSLPGWNGYVEAGTGMADALRLASQRNAYTLSDRPTYEALKEQLQLTVLWQGDDILRNQYSVLVVSGSRNPEGARAFAAWLSGRTARELMGGYRAGGTGPALFTPDAPHDAGSS